MKRAVFPGSFDPITVGHESVIRRSLGLFDEVIVAIGVNANKRCMFDIEERQQFIKAVFADEPRIKVAQFEGLTVDFCKEVDADYILRGLRTSADFEFERSIGQINNMLKNRLETVFLLTDKEHTPINSSIIRDILKHGGDVSEFVPSAILPLIGQTK
jgi:pantetheine-phosphate adenylyltransferase